MVRKLHSLRGRRLIRASARQGIVLAAAVSLAAPAFAHPGMDAAWHDLQSGWLHPFTGLDHLLAMLALGLWAGQNGGRGIALMPAGFLGCMALGGLLAVAGGTLPVLEPVILASLLAFGIAIAAAVQLPDRAAVVVVGAFALFHGAAHGLEMPAESGALHYASGFVLATAMLHVAGLALALALKRAGWMPVTRFAGAGVALTGAVLLLQ